MKKIVSGLLLSFFGNIFAGVIAFLALFVFGFPLTLGGFLQGSDMLEKSIQAGGFIVGLVAFNVVNTLLLKKVSDPIMKKGIRVGYVLNIVWITSLIKIMVN